MTDESSEKAATKDLETEPGRMRVVRDVTFTRCVADRGIVLNLGRDLEIAFLQLGPNLVTLTDHGDTEGLAMDPVVTETARVRLPWPSGLDLAMNVIREGIEKGAVNVPLVIEAINSYAADSEGEAVEDAT